MCFSPKRRAIFRHLNFKKWSEHAVFCTFWLENALLATTACDFSTSQLPKVVRTCSVLYILTWKCTSRHSGVQFFDISTSKNGPSMQCFVLFWLGNVLLATAACNFSTSQLQKVLRTPQFFNILTWKFASRHSGVQFLISPLTTWLRTRRFNEPTFRLTRHTNHWKNTAFRDFSNIWRGWLFFLLTFALLHLLSSDSTSSSDFTFLWLYFIYLLFICFSTLHIVRSLLFKLPSMMYPTFLSDIRFFSGASRGWSCRSEALRRRWCSLRCRDRPASLALGWSTWILWTMTLLRFYAFRCATAIFSLIVHTHTHAANMSLNMSNLFPSWIQQRLLKTHSPQNHQVKCLFWGEGGS